MVIKLVFLQTNCINKQILINSKTFRSDDAVNMFKAEEWSAITMINFLSMLGERLANSTLSHPNVQSLMKYEKNFDAVVIEVFWAEALYGEDLDY